MKTLGLNTVPSGELVDNFFFLSNINKTHFLFQFHKTYQVLCEDFMFL